MHRLIFPIALYASMFTSMAFASFSAFVVISPETESAHERPTIKQENGLVIVRVPFFEDGQKYWLIVADKKLPKERLNFRTFIWGGEGKRKDVVLIALLAPKETSQERNESTVTRREVVVALSPEFAQRSYIYHDFSAPVMDGGVYYTVDISSYL